MSVIQALLLGLVQGITEFRSFSHFRKFVSDKESDRIYL